MEAAELHEEVHGPEVIGLVVLLGSAMKNVVLEREGMRGECGHIERFIFQKYTGIYLKALFNNVFTLKNLSCMALHAIIVFGKV